MYGVIRIDSARLHVNYTSITHQLHINCISIAHQLFINRVAQLEDGAMNAPHSALRVSCCPGRRVRRTEHDVIPGRDSRCRRWSVWPPTRRVAQTVPRLPQRCCALLYHVDVRRRSPRLRDHEGNIATPGLRQRRQQVFDSDNADVQMVVVCSNVGHQRIDHGIKVLVGDHPKLIRQRNGRLNRELLRVARPARLDVGGVGSIEEACVESGWQRREDARIMLVIIRMLKQQGILAEQAQLHNVVKR